LRLARRPADRLLSPVTVNNFAVRGVSPSVTWKAFSTLSVERLLGVGLVVGMLAMHGGAVLAGDPAGDKARRVSGQSQPPSQRDSRRGFSAGADSGSQGRGVPGAPEPRAWWRDAAMAREVGLKPSQISKIDHLYESRQKQIQPKLDEYKLLKSDLDQMFREGTVAPEVVEAKARRMTYPQMDIVVSRLRLLYEMSRVMSPEQNEKLRAIFDRERREQSDRGSRGPGRNLPRP